MIDAIAVPEQPFADVPITVKDEFVEGETVMLDAVAPPGFQTYPSPPVAVIVKLVPAQISEFKGKTFIDGLGIIVTITSSVDVQMLFASDTVNV